MHVLVQGADPYLQLKIRAHFLNRANELSGLRSGQGRVKSARYHWEYYLTDGLHLASWCDRARIQARCRGSILLGTVLLVPRDGSLQAATPAQVVPPEAQKHARGTRCVSMAHEYVNGASVRLSPISPYGLCRGWGAGGKQGPSGYFKRQRGLCRYPESISGAT